MDPLTPQQRHANMAAIHGKDTKPEIIVRKWLWRRGFRYRLNHHRLPGKPDIVMRKYRTCIFVNGCFWHGHEIARENLQLIIENALSGFDGSECCRIPKTNRVFWVTKILRNQQRDIEVQHKLAEMGWHCISVWECELKPSKREKTLEALEFTLNRIFLQDHSIRRYEMPEEESQMAADRDASQSVLGDCKSPSRDIGIANPDEL